MQVVALGPRPVLASETVTVDATAGGVALSSSKYTKQDNDSKALPQAAVNAFITVEDAEIRFNVDPAVTVTATTNGHIAQQASSFEIHGQAIRNFRAIRTGGTSGTIRVTYFY